MSEIEQLLADMMSEGATLWAEDGQVRFRAPAGVVTHDRAAVIRASRSRVIEYLNQIKPRAVAPTPSGAIPMLGRTVAPLSYAQTRVWLVECLGTVGAAYNMPASVRIAGDLEIRALERSLQEVIARHEALRTRLTVVDGVPQQVIDPPADFALEVVDLSGLDGPAREAQVRSRSESMACTRFQLDKDRLLRVVLLKREARDYLLLICMHHAISDGWSVGVFVGELAALYQAFVRGIGSPLPRIQAQYADYAQWERSRLSATFLANHTEYWRKELAGVPMSSELPSDFPRPAVQSFRGAEVSFALSESLSSSWRALARQEGGTLFCALLAVFNVLLSRWSGQQDLVIGTPVAGRNHRQTEAMIGLFVNMLPIRSRIDNSVSFRQLLRNVSQVTLEAYAHQEVPFEQLVALADCPRDRSRQPLFQVAVVFENMPRLALELPGLSLQESRIEGRTAKFDLTLFLREVGGGITGYLEYATDLFHHTTIERLIGHYQILLERLAATPDGRIGELSLLSAADRCQMRAWNDTRVDYPREQTLPEIFEAHARCAPNHPAVIFGDTILSYSQLNDKANRLAAYLRHEGVGPDDLVGICMERSPEMLIGMLAILKAGGAYLPLDAGVPPDRILELLEDAQPRLLLTHGLVAARVANKSIRCVCIESHWPLIATYPAENPDPKAIGYGSRHLAYVIYTSGSTGRPKGVMVEHRNVSRLVINNPYTRIDPEDRVVNCSNPAFDATTWEIWAALLNGASVVVIRQSVLLDPLLFARELAEQAATALWMTVGLFNEYVDRMGTAFRGLKYLIVGGDALEPRTVDRLLRSSYGPRQMLNGYGPTETTTFAAMFAIHGVPERARSVPIGGPIANTQIHILDPMGQEVPVGVAGEIYIAGDGVARGYLNRPELTAERFVNNPFSDTPGERMYRSGDLGCWRADGQIEFLGRNDNQVKLRGFRIELGEIEARLISCPGVREALVVVRVESTGEKRLVAYFTAMPGAEPEDRELRRLLQERLPEYMVPAAWVRLAAFPLTSNGKVDRAALPLPGMSREHGDSSAGPTTDIERALADIWREVLMRDEIGRDENFFEAGGNSLLAVRALSRAATRLAVHIPMSILYEAPTIAGIARALQEQLDEGGGGDCLMRLRRGEPNHPALHLIHPIGGHLLGYRHLLMQLDSRRPVFGLQRPEIRRGAKPLVLSVADLAERYLEEILQLPAQAPYQLCGWSFGGIVALELAARLEALGKPVGYVGLIDSMLPVPDPDAEAGLESWRGGLAETNLPQLPSRLRGRLEEVMSTEAQAGVSNASEAGSELFSQLYAANLWALYTYRPTIRLNASVHYYCAARSSASAGFTQSLAALRRISRNGLKFHALEGDHYSIVAPPLVASLAQGIESALGAGIASSNNVALCRAGS